MWGLFFSEGGNLNLSLGFLGFWLSSVIVVYMGMEGYMDRGYRYFNGFVLILFVFYRFDNV